MSIAQYELTLLTYQTQRRDPETAREQYEWLYNTVEPISDERPSRLLLRMKLWLRAGKPQETQGANDARPARAI